MRSSGPRRTLLILALLPWFAPAGAGAQEAAAESSDRRVRLGIALGGTGLVGVSFEYQWEEWGAEATVGTVGFRDVSFSLAGKRYLSTGSLRPAMGFGLWNLSAWSEEGSGSVLVLRIPIAAEWKMNAANAMGIEVGLNRAVWVRRLDPEDDRPPSGSLVPFPGMYYRYGWDP